MHRLGFDEAALRHWHARLQAASQVSELNLISLACADERGNSLTELQLERFLDVLDLPLPSARWPTRRGADDSCRAHGLVAAGHALYGASPFAELSAGELGLRPAMSLRAEVIALREVQAGETVGYGGELAGDDTRIATVSRRRRRLSAACAQRYPGGNGQRRWPGGADGHAVCGSRCIAGKKQLGSEVELWGQRLRWMRWRVAS